MEIISTKLNINFMSKAPYALLISSLGVLASIYLFVSEGQKKYGIDFSGGHQAIVETAAEAKANSEVLRNALAKQGLNDAVVQDFEASATSRKFAIRVAVEGGATEESPEASKAVLSKIDAALKTLKGENKIIANEFIGPTIGDELKTNATIAVALGLLAILIYITYRFEFAFALGAVVAVFHDVIIATGIYLFSGTALTMGTLAAVLTVLGYSVNDTIVIFDRMREEMIRAKKFDLAELMNNCINATLSRTIITSLVTQFMALALLLYGGGSITDLSLLLVVGIFVGCYSTIFIASPVALYWETYTNPMTEGGDAAKA